MGLTHRVPRTLSTPGEKIDELAGRLARGLGEKHFVQNYFHPDLSIEEKIDKLLVLVKRHFQEESPEKQSNKLPASVLPNILEY